MERMSEVSELPNSLNLAFLESVYEVYLRDSASLSREWVRYFDGLSQRDDSHVESGFPLSPVPANLSAPPSTNGTVSNGRRPVLRG
jgi:2-oxoglutarate dehydrogenase complex dehydrogenase (E1) component-like enzyme